MTKQRASSHKNGGWLAWTIVLSVVLIAVVVYSFYVFTHSISDGVSAAVDSFQETYDHSKTDTYDQFHQIAYETAEAEHHVRNRVAISLYDIKEKAELEVLGVSEVVYDVRDGSESTSGTTSWLKVSGSGVFTVNLAAAEYIVDQERQYVLVRIPKPILAADSIGIDETELIYFEENVLKRSNSVKSGAELAKEQLREAEQLIREDFEADEQYLRFAETSAQLMISGLIQGINPDVENLQVEIEFL